MTFHPAGETRPTAAPQVATDRSRSSLSASGDHHRSHRRSRRLTPATNTIPGDSNGRHQTTAPSMSGAETSQFRPQSQVTLLTSPAAVDAA